MSIWDCDKPLDAMMLSHDHIAMLAVKHGKEIEELKRLVTPMMQFNSEKLTAKCAVKDCESRMGQEYFNGFLCTPCHQFVSGEGGLNSKAYWNSRKMIDTAVAMERALAKQPTKICGPNLVGVLNAAGFYQKKEWVDLPVDEATIIWERVDERDGWELIMQVQKALKEKNT